MNSKSLFAMLVAVPLALSGCSDKQEAPPAASKETKAVATTEPATLKVFLAVAMTDEEFDMYFTKPMKKLHPHITLEIVRGKPGFFLPEMIASGQTPDVIYYQSNTRPLLVHDYPMDLRDMIKKYDVDMNRIEPGLIRYGDNGEIFGIPLAQNGRVLWYNKNIFDKFAVPYPKNIVTWEETVELTRKLTRMDGPVQYSGFHPFHSGIQDLADVFTIPMVDSKTDKAIVSPKWNELFTLGMNIFNVSGNKPEKMLNSTQSRKAFVNDQSLAMIVHQFNAMLPELQVMKANGVNYDLSAPPRHASTPDTKAPNSYNHLVVGKSTKYPEQAFQFVSSILTDDVQSVSSRNGRIPVIINPGVQKLFGQDNEYFKGKNIDALFAKGKVREEREGGPYDAIVQSKIVEAFNAVYQGTDINTALRNAEEAANKAIAAEKAK